MGLDKISVTLYDLLGYLLPGYVLLLACSIAEASFWGSGVFALSRISRNPILAAVVAYFLGQASHAVGSWIKTKRYKWFDDRGSYRLNPEVCEQVSQVLQETYGLKLGEDKKLSKIDRYVLADSYIVASGGSVERDILMAREGFFKASVVAFAVLSLTVFSTLFAPVARIQVQPGVFVFPNRFGIISLTIILLLLVWLFRQRFIFFNCIKTNNALLTFLALRQKGTEGRDPDKG
jgi:protein-S-isoprenylcysteine O-methyltransferase Ste14